MTDVLNRAVVLHGAGDVRVEERPEPVPGTGDVQVHVELGGICGSDLSYYRHGAVGRFTVKRPMILGHEVIGTVRRAGGDVSNGVEGERFAVDPSSPCMRCDRCREGRTNTCMNPTFLGSASTDPHVDGGFSSLLVTSAQNLVPLPAHLTGSAAVFAEPLAVNVHAIRRAGGVADKRILIIGAGPIGSILAAATLAEGAGEVTVVDLDQARLDRVHTMGVHHVTQPQDAEFRHEFDVVFEASGSAPGIAAAIEATRRAGTMVMVGLPHSDAIPLPIGLGVTNEIDVLGSFRFCHDEFVHAVELLSGGLDLAPLHTGSFAVSDAGSAFEYAVSGGAMKTQVDFSDDHHAP